MSDKFKNVYFSGDPLYITHVLDLLLLKNLHCHLLRGEVVVAQFHLAEGALADSLAQHVVAHILELALRLTGCARCWLLLLLSCCVLTLLRAMMSFCCSRLLGWLRGSAATSRMRRFLRATFLMGDISWLGLLKMGAPRRAH